LGHREGDFPVSEQAAREIISLPIYPELGVDDVNYICQTIGDFFRGKRTRPARAAAPTGGGMRK
jgi:dTDP-4-amino-4,6-dideoxygalactose transaminase